MGMTVKQLRKKLEKYADDVEVIIDGDDEGYYTLEKVKPNTVDDKRKQVCNLISSNES